MNSLSFLEKERASLIDALSIIKEEYAPLKHKIRKAKGIAHEKRVFMSAVEYANLERDVFQKGKEIDRIGFELSKVNAKISEVRRNQEDASNEEILLDSERRVIYEFLMATKKATRKAIIAMRENDDESAIKIIHDEIIAEYNKIQYSHLTVL